MTKLAASVLHAAASVLDLAMWVETIGFRRCPRETVRMQYHVVVVQTEEGFAVSCPALPGCHSQGATHAEALANIREAITLWLEVAEEDTTRELAAEGARFTRELVTV